MLSVLTGNVGINGGNSGVREGGWDLGVEWLPMLENPVKTQISVFTWTDAIDHGTEMTAPVMVFVERKTGCPHQVFMVLRQ